MNPFKRMLHVSAPNHFHSVLFRLILTFTLTLTPIFIMGLAIYRVGVAQLDRQITVSLSQQVDFKLQELENQMQLAQNQMNQLVDEKDILQLSGMSDLMSYYEQIYQLNRLQERIAIIRNANSFVKQIVVYLPQLDRSLYAAQLYSGQSVIGEIDEQRFEQVWKMSASMPNRVVSDGNMLIYTGQQPQPLAIESGRKPRLLFVIEYDMSSISRYFENILPNIQTNSLLILDNGVILGSEIDEIYREYMLKRVELNHTDWNWNNEQYYVISRYSTQLNAHYALYASRTEAFAELNEFRAFLIVLLALFIVALILYGVRTYRDVHTPLKLLTGAFERLAQGDMDFQVKYNKHNEFQYLTDKFNLMLLKLKDTVAQLYKQRILMQQAQIKQLQAQINPHFLYNSFFILDNMIAMEDYEVASIFSRRLGQYFRYVTRDARDTVPLSEELDHARSYAEVQRIRFGRRIEIVFPDNPPEAQHVFVPRLTLQPIIENAFVHSLERAERGKLEVRIFCAEGCLQLEVESTGFTGGEERLSELVQTLNDESPDKEITGLINVHRRLRLTHRNGLSFRLEQPDSLVVALKLIMGE